MIRLKTAVLLGFSLELGAMLAGASEEEQLKIRAFGENIGIGFQLKDDLLDVYGNPDKFGKQVGGDIVANKKTYLLLEAIAQAKGDTKTQLEHWLAQKDFDIAEKVKAVTDIYNTLGIKEKTEQKIQYFFDLAFTQLHELHARDPQKQFLDEFMKQLIAREN
jgi:geranylgeranyl diphosphate synthase type II